MSVLAHKDATAQAYAMAVWAEQHRPIMSQLPLPWRASHPKVELTDMTFRCSECNKAAAHDFFRGDVTHCDDGNWLILAVGICAKCGTAAWCAWRVTYSLTTQSFFHMDVRDAYPIPVKVDGTVKRTIEL